MLDFLTNIKTKQYNFNRIKMVKNAVYTFPKTCFGNYF